MNLQYGIGLFCIFAQKIDIVYLCLTFMSCIYYTLNPQPAATY